MGERFSALPRMLGGALSGRYPAMSRGRVGLIVLALAYLVSPLDLVPEAFVPLLGLADDGVVALWLGGAFLAETERFLAWEREQHAVVDAPRA
ncbi:YkvA family protein [Pseudonocardia sp. DLS-67]